MCDVNAFVIIRFLPELKAKLLQEAKMNFLSKFRDNNKDIEQTKDAKRTVHINIPQNGLVVVKVMIVMFIIILHRAKNVRDIYFFIYTLLHLSRGWLTTI